MLNVTQIPAPRVPLIDPNTGLITREWYMFFFNLFNLNGGGQSDFTIEDLLKGVQPTDISGDLANLYQDGQLAAMMSQFEATNRDVIQELRTLPSTQLGTLASVNEDDVRYLRFNNYPSPEPGTQAGTMSWNDTGGLDIHMGVPGDHTGLSNITQQVGEEIYVYGKASAAINDSPLQIIYKTGVVGASGAITFAPTIAGITDIGAIIGVATEPIANNSFGRVTTFGVVRNITTNGAAYGEVWADGDDIWYNPVTGNPTKNKPSAPKMKTQVGTIINAGAGGSGSFQVLLLPGSVLGGTDSNVQFSSLTDKDLIQYDSALQYWKNVAPTAITGTSADKIKVVDDAATATSVYPIWATAATGAYQATYATTSKMSFIPSTGVMSLTGLSVSNTITGSISGSASTATTATNANNVAITDDTSTNAVMYPVWVTANTGNLPAKVTSSKLTYNPSTGLLTTAGLTVSNTITGSISGNAATATTATNVTGGAAGSLVYQTGASATGTLALGTTDYVLTAGATAPRYVAQSTLSVGSATTATTATNSTNAAITNDVATATAVYPVWSGASTGNNALKVSATTLSLIPSTGSVGFGILSPSYPVDVYRSSTTTSGIVARNDTSSFYCYSANTASFVGTITNTYFGFIVNNTEKARITTDSAAYLRLASGTGGVQFGGNSAAANALNYYEEGTWTATLYDAASAGNASSTTKTGYYTRFGNRVTINIYDWNNIVTTGMTAGNVMYFSLPFTASSTGGSAGSLTTEVFAFPASTSYLICSVGNSGARATIIATGSGVANVFVTVGAITTGVSDIERLTMTYMV